MMYRNVYRGVVDCHIEDAHREKTISNKTPALIKSMNMDIRVAGTSNQLFRRGSYSETKFSKK